MAVFIPRPISGWCSKQSRTSIFYHTWRKRFFIIEMGRLFYYESANEDQTGGCGLKSFMSLEGAEIYDEDGLMFDMKDLAAETSTKPVIVYLVSGCYEEDIIFEISNATLAFDWVDTIQQHIQFATAHPTMLEDVRSINLRHTTQDKLRGVDGPNDKNRFSRLRSDSTFDSKWNTDLRRFEMQFSSICLESDADRDVALLSTDLRTNIPVVFTFLTHPSYAGVTDKDIAESVHSHLRPRSFSLQPPSRNSSTPLRRLSLELSRLKESLSTRRSSTPAQSSNQSKTPNESVTQETRSSLSDEEVMDTTRSTIDECHNFVRFDIHPSSWFFPSTPNRKCATADVVNSTYQSSILMPPASQEFLEIKILVPQNRKAIDTILAADGNKNQKIFFNKIRRIVAASHGINLSEEDCSLIYLKDNAHLYEPLISGTGSEFEARKMPLIIASNGSEQEKKLKLKNDDTYGNSIVDSIEILTSIPSILNHIRTIHPKRGVTFSMSGTGSKSNSETPGLQNINVVINLLSHPICNFIESSAKSCKKSCMDISFSSVDEIAIMSALNSECNFAPMLLGEATEYNDPSSRTLNLRFDVITSDNIIRLCSVKNTNGQQSQSFCKTLASCVTPALSLPIIGGRIRTALGRYADVVMTPHFKTQLVDDAGLVDEIKPFEVVQFSLESLNACPPPCIGPNSENGLNTNTEDVVDAILIEPYLLYSRYEIFSKLKKSVVL